MIGIYDFSDLHNPRLVGSVELGSYQVRVNDIQVAGNIAMLRRVISMSLIAPILKTLSLLIRSRLQGSRITSLLGIISLSRRRKLAPDLRQRQSAHLILAGVNYVRATRWRCMATLSLISTMMAICGYSTSATSSTVSEPGMNSRFRSPPAGNLSR